jgi:acetylornithine deacetylase/succinyl-diaminopimelate desuccinylase-like protein
VTGEGTRTIAEMCAREFLAPLGIEARLIPSITEGKEQVNLLATIKGSDRTATPIVLNTHLDTVPPGDPANWTECARNPFAATIRDDRIFGLGTADTKLDFLAKVLALADCGTPRRDVFLVGTFGEEHGLVGAKEIAAAGLLPRHALAYIGEPSRLQVITAHKGLMVFELTIRSEPRRSNAPEAPRTRLIFEGRAAHSSTPKLGRNAIKMTLEALSGNPHILVESITGGDAVNKVPARCEAVVIGDATRIMSTTSVESAGKKDDLVLSPEAISALTYFVEELERFADRAGEPETDYAAPTLTCNPGVIRTSEGALTLEFELRPPPALAVEKVLKGVAETVGLVAQRIPQVKLELLEHRMNPGFRSALDGETVELAMAALARAGLALETGVKAGCTEAGIYAGHGLKPVVFGPGPSTGVIHAPNEHNFIADVEGAIAFYGELLRI